MAQHLALLLDHYGLLLVFASALVDQAGVPVPALPILVVAGALAAIGQLSLPVVVAAGCAGCLVADMAWFAIGRRFGARVLGGLCRLSLSPDSCVHRSELHFERWRGRSLLVAKFVPGLSVVVPPLVGALGLGWRTFVLLDAAGALLWVGVCVLVGYVFAGQVGQLLLEVERAGGLVLEGVVGLIVLYIAWRYWRRWRLRRGLRLPRMTPAQLYGQLQGEAAPLVIDVRSALSRQLEPWIIRGALLVDAEHAAQVLAGVPAGRTIVSYCSCPNEATSAQVARGLGLTGRAHVRPLAGGLQAWRQAGYPVERLPRTVV